VIEHGARVGRYFKGRLEGLKEKFSFIRDVRGEGLLLGLDLSCPGKPVVKACMDRGFLINCTQEHVLRFIPPLIVEEALIDSLVACLEEIFGEMKPQQ
jgi:acetylornithine/N-succinyldiaminopimelate aminotransferase